MSSISTTALRLAVIEALAPTPLIEAGAASGWPTMAGPMVLDTGSVTHDRTTAHGAVVISVYSDEVRGAPRGDALGYDPQDLTIDLVFDVEMPIVDGDTGAVGIAACDADAAMRLDLCAAQIRRALVVSPLLVPGLVKGYGRIESRWARDADLGVRLARLTLRVSAGIDDDDWSDVTDGLPWPASAVRAVLPPTSYGAGLLDRVAAVWSPPASPVPLEEIRFGFDPDAVDAPASTDTAAVQGGIVFD